MKFQKGETIVRDDCRFPAGALSVVGYDAGGSLLAHPLGGGVQFIIPESDLRRFRVVPVEEQQARPYRAGVFGIEGIEETFRGWTKGERWNGWSMPCFELDEAKRLAPLLNETTYDAQKDAFITVSGDGPEAWEAQTIVTNDGRLIKAYPIGAGAWIWEER